MDIQSTVVILSAVLVLITAKRDRDLYCAVCRALVDEVHWTISQVDPKKTIQVGSFRVDGSGNQNTHQRPYARSEVHLTEVMESVCEEFKQYAQTSSDGKNSIVRTSSRSGKALSLKNISISSELQKSIKFYCESLIEEYEEDMIALFRRDKMSNIEGAICGDIAQVCSEDDLRTPMPVAEAEEEEIDEVTREEEPEQGEVDAEEEATAEGEVDQETEKLKERLQDMEKELDEVAEEKKSKEEESKTADHRDNRNSEQTEKQEL